MKFPETEFKRQLKSKYPLSSFIVFGQFVEGKKLPKFYVGKWSLQAVDKRDHDSADEAALIEHLCRRTAA